MNLVQIIRGCERRVGVVKGSEIQLLTSHSTVYSLALAAIGAENSLVGVVGQFAGKESLDYDAIYEGRSEWRLLPPFDQPENVSRCLVSGTGLTHKKSAENRAAMHQRASDQITDSIRMYRMGLEAGTPPAGQIGCPPEWFYKGNGAILKAHGEDLTTPSFADDGGEEPEVVGAYLIAPAGIPYRVGLMIGNEFSDHQLERKNYLYLAPSKLRNCSVGPELAIGDVPFDDVSGIVSVFRNQRQLWHKEIWSGEKNMAHSLANLEHHHFKYPQHRRPGDVHIHFFGADAFSFGDGIALEAGDVMQVSFPPLGRPLRNTLRICAGPESLITVGKL